MSAVMVLLHGSVALFSSASFTGVPSDRAFGPLSCYRTRFLFPKVLSEHQIHGAGFISNWSPKKYTYTFLINLLIS